MMTKLGRGDVDDDIEGDSDSTGGDDDDTYTTAFPQCCHGGHFLLLPLVVASITPSFSLKQRLKTLNAQHPPTFPQA